MENEEKAGQTPDASAAAPCTADAHPKPMLTVEQQIAHMKAKGITFELVSEEEAAAYLTDRTYFFKLYAYRTLFERRVGGPRDGQYVGLDFGHLKLLASLDRTLRYALLPMTLDVEHFARSSGDIETNADVMQAIARTGISHRVRTAKMSNPRLQQIATLLYLHAKSVPEGTAKARARNDIAQFSARMDDALEALSKNDAARSSFTFLMKLFDKWF